MMQVISVDLDRWPQHREQITRHAVRWLYDGATAQLPVEVWESIRAGEEPSGTPIESQESYVMGVGDHLEAIIAERFGEYKRAGCGCKDMIQKMNRWGADECERRIEEIVDHLMDQREALGKWYLRQAAKVPGVRVYTRAMMREAIKRARAADADGRQTRQPQMLR